MRQVFGGEGSVTENRWGVVASGWEWSCRGQVMVSLWCVGVRKLNMAFQKGVVSVLKRVESVAVLHVGIFWDGEAK